jgi:hypothetical protein
VIGCALEGEELEREPGVEEKAEFLYPNLKKAGEEEVASLMKRDEEGKAEDELEDL